MSPQRIVILGGSGAGKSRLARILGRHLGLAVVHFDPLYWGPGWTPGDPDEFRARVAEAVAGERWITDGLFVNLAGDLFLPRAELVVWIEQPMWLRLARALWRAHGPAEPGRPDLPEGCTDSVNAEAFGFIRDFERKQRPVAEAALARWAADTPVVHLKGDRAVTRFLAGLAEA